MNQVDVEHNNADPVQISFREIMVHVDTPSNDEITLKKWRTDFRIIAADSSSYPSDHRIIADYIEAYIQLRSNDSHFDSAGLIRAAQIAREEPQAVCSPLLGALACGLVLGMGSYSALAWPNIDVAFL